MVADTDAFVNTDDELLDGWTYLNEGAIDIVTPLAGQHGIRTSLCVDCQQRCACDA